MKITWIATDNPNIIAASGYPVQIERLPGKFIVTGYGKSFTTNTLYMAQCDAEHWVEEQTAFNEISGVES